MVNKVIKNNRLNDFTQLGTLAEVNYRQKQRVQQPSGQEIGGFSPPQSAQRLIKFLSLSSQINGSIFPSKSFPENVKVSEKTYSAEKCLLEFHIRYTSTTLSISSLTE